MTRKFFEGGRELDMALQALGPRLGKAVLERTLLKAATPIHEDAQAAAPSREPGAEKKTYRTAAGGKKVRRPGTLKVLVQKGTRLTARQARAARKAGKDTAEVYVGTRDPVGRLKERGTATNRPEPFLRPAWEAHKDEALEIIKTELGGEIDKAAKRVAQNALRAAKKAGR